MRIPLALLLLTFPWFTAPAAVCKGEDPCRACNDCSACAYCSPKNPKGGSCGVLRSQEARERNAAAAKREKKGK